LHTQHECASFKFIWFDTVKKWSYSKVLIGLTIMDQVHFYQESLVNLLSLPVELLVYIISFLSSTRDKVRLRYVSRWLKYVIEGTPSLWNEFVWPFYNCIEECTVKELLKVYGQHIKVLSFTNSRVPLTLVEMLWYCSNVQHLSLPSTKLDPEQLKKTIHHMRCLQTLQLEVDSDSNIQQILANSGQLRELTIFLTHYDRSFTVEEELFKRWIKIQMGIPSFDKTSCLKINYLVDCAKQLTATGTTVNFKLYSSYSYRKVPLNFSPTLPYLQLHSEGSGQMTIPCIRLSDFGILGLQNDVAVMTNCQYGEKTIYMVRYMFYRKDDNIVSMLNSIRITRCGNLYCSTHFDLTNCICLNSGHLEQLAIACPNLQRLNLHNCYYCLKSLQGLRALINHCHNLQGLNVLGIHISNVENQILFWEILGDTKLTHLAVEFSFLRPKAAIKKMLFCSYQKCCTIRGIQCYDDWWTEFTYEDTAVLSYFTSLSYCCVPLHHRLPTIVQDVINNCKQLTCAYFCSYWVNHPIYHPLSLGIINNHNLEQLYIDSPHTDVPDHFMNSVSAHSGLVHVVMKVRSLTIEGITSLVRSSPKLITLCLCVSTIDADVEYFNATLNKLFQNRKLFTAGLYYCSDKLVAPWYISVRDVLWEQKTDLFPLW